jgi:hypothetical protein
LQYNRRIVTGKLNDNETARGILTRFSGSCLGNVKASASSSSRRKALAQLVLLLWVWTCRASWAQGPWSPAAIIEDDRIKEVSGVAPASRSGEFWCLNDSGHPAEIFRIGPSGRVLQAVDLRGAKNVDWEAMTLDDQGRLIIADIGDNGRKRSDYQLYILPEPAPEAAFAEPAATVSFRYADGQSHDAESIFSMAGNLYLITRELSPNAHPAVFRLDSIGPNVAEARFVASLQAAPMTSDAVYLPDRRELVTLSYAAITTFSVARESELQRPPISVKPILLGQCEALCVQSGQLLVTTEPGMIWRFPLQQKKPDE